MKNASLTNSSIFYNRGTVGKNFGTYTIVNYKTLKRYGQGINVNNMNNVYYVTSEYGANSLGYVINEINTSTSTKQNIVYFDDLTYSEHTNYIINKSVVITPNTSNLNATLTLKGSITLNGYNSILTNININNSETDGIIINSNGNLIQKCEITFSKNNGIEINGSFNTIINNIIKSNFQNGIIISGKNAHNNLIGNNPNNNAYHYSNIINENLKNGILIDNSDSNVIRSNFIGISDTGIYGQPNVGNGIHITNGSKNNIVGGKQYTSNGIINNPTGSEGIGIPITIKPPMGNVISSNLLNGILIDNNSENIYIHGNFIGTLFSGNNDNGNNENGILIDNCKHIYIIGCEENTNPFVFYNVISGNKKNGLMITNSSDIVIHANFIGNSASNLQSCGNLLNGILINGNSNNIKIGGVLPFGNVIGGNGENGIYLTDDVNNVSLGNNFIGLMAFNVFTSNKYHSLPNSKNGMLIDANVNNIIAYLTISSSNGENGVKLDGNSRNNVFSGLVCGTDIITTSPSPNNENGLLITGNSSYNSITMNLFPNVGVSNNVFSGNNQNGIKISGNSNNNIIEYSLIGCSLFKEYIPDLGNKNGIYITDNAFSNTIQLADKNNPQGGTNYNEIVSNKEYGILIDGSATNNLIKYNYIGERQNDNNILYQNRQGNYLDNTENQNNTYIPLN